MDARKINVLTKGYEQVQRVLRHTGPACAAVGLQFPPTLHEVYVERRGKNDILFWNILIPVARSFLLISSLGLFLACSSLCVPMTVSIPSVSIRLLFPSGFLFLYCQ